MNSLFDFLDDWWGQRFDSSLGERIYLPQDQALILQEASTGWSVERLEGPASRFSLEPAMNPWGIENHEVIFAVAHTRMMADMLNGLNQPGEAYAFSRYEGYYAINPVKETHRAVGPHWIITERDRWNDLNRTWQKISSLALFCPVIHLCIKDIMPAPPAEGLSEGAWNTWLEDVRARLSTLVLLRPLADVGGLVFVSPDSSGSEIPDKDMLSQILDIERADRNELLQGIRLHIGRDGEPRYRTNGSVFGLPSSQLDGYDHFYNDRMAETFAMQKIVDTFSWSAQSSAQILVQYSAAQRIIDSLLSEHTKLATPERSLMQSFMTMKIGENATLPTVLHSAYQLRRTGQFAAWRESLGNSLRAIGDLGPEDDLSQAREHVFRAMKPSMEQMQRNTGLPMTLEEAGESVTKGIAIGVAGFGISAAAGAPLLPAAGTAMLTGLARPFLDFLVSRRHNKSAAWEAYVSLQN